MLLKVARLLLAWMLLLKKWNILCGPCLLFKSKPVMFWTWMTENDVDSNFFQIIFFSVCNGCWLGTVQKLLLAVVALKVNCRHDHERNRRFVCSSRVWSTSFSQGISSPSSLIRDSSSAPSISWWMMGLMRSIQEWWMWGRSNLINPPSSFLLKLQLPRVKCLYLIECVEEVRSGGSQPVGNVSFHKYLCL